MSVADIGHLISKRSKPQDVYYTPPDLVKMHLRECVPYYTEGDLVFDPFYGKGAYYNLYDEFFPNCRKEFTEIALGKDFFEYTGKPDIVVSNPPFSILAKVMTRLVELRPRCVSLLLGTINCNRNRLQLMDEGGYNLVSYRIESVCSWFGESCLMTWIRKEHCPHPLFTFSWGSKRHKNIDGYVPPKDRKKQITTDSSTPASE